MKTSIQIHICTLQHTATHCSTLQRTAAHCNALQHSTTYHFKLVFAVGEAAVIEFHLQLRLVPRNWYVVVSCSVLQRVAVSCSEFHLQVRLVPRNWCVAVSCSVLQRVAVSCSELQGVAMVPSPTVCCSVLCSAPAPTCSPRFDRIFMSAAQSLHSKCIKTGPDSFTVADTYSYMG